MYGYDTNSYGEFGEFDEFAEMNGFGEAWGEGAEDRFFVRRVLPLIGPLRQNQNRLQQQLWQTNAGVSLTGANRKQAYRWARGRPHASAGEWYWTHRLAWDTLIFTFSDAMAFAAATFFGERHLHQDNFATSIIDPGFGKVAGSPLPRSQPASMSHVHATRIRASRLCDLFFSYFNH